MFSKLLSFLLLSLLFIYSSFSLADGIGLNKSRIIFEQKSKSETVEIENNNNIPYLVQASILSSLDETVANNFIVTPPLFRVDANNKYTVRILPNDIKNLPDDRESIFYFKVRAIPPTKNQGEEKADLVFITAIIIKMYHRPTNISELSSSKLNTVELVNKKGIWKINNPTPHYITIVDLSLNNKSQQGSLLIPPFEELDLNTTEIQIKQATGRFIDDFGGISEKYNLIKLKETNAVVIKK